MINNESQPLLSCSGSLLFRENIVMQSGNQPHLSEEPPPLYTMANLIGSVIALITLTSPVYIINYFSNPLNRGNPPASVAGSSKPSSKPLGTAAIVKPHPPAN